MKILMIAGSHPRHLYVVRKVAATGHLVGVVFMMREKLNCDVPEDIEPDLVQLYRHHFDLRAEMEDKYFGEVDEEFIRSINHIFVDPTELNGRIVGDFIQKSGAEMLISYGPNLIRNNILELVDGNALNLHGGLSPYYKGAATMFWPFYFLEPNYVGTTLHYITSKIDAGRIVHQTVPELCKGDGMHEVACKAIVKAAEELSKIVINMGDGIIYEGVEQKKTGKLFLNKDWRSEHLRLIYETYKDRIVDLYLDGKINKGNEPQLVTVI